MNFTKVALAALCLTWAHKGEGQTVYKCEIDGQTVFSQQPCADDAEEHEIVESYTPDGSVKSTGIDFQRTTCRTRGTGTTEAILELANMTNEIKAGELTIQFIRGGSIIGVARERFLLAPWGSETFNRLGPVGVTTDRCEYRITTQS